MAIFTAERNNTGPCFNNTITEISDKYAENQSRARISVACH